MTEEQVYNVNVLAQDLLPTPEEIKGKLPASGATEVTVLTCRQNIEAILDRRDHRWLMVVGPCSIHDTDAVSEYAGRLQKLAAEVQDTLLIVMRVYFEKPRTAVGWKGFINDPRMDDSFHMEEGLERARRLLLDITGAGLPVGTEALDPITPQYLGDLMSWSAVGARTTESQTHREMASGLSTPVGFKNGTDGGLEVALNALKSAASPHSFLGIDQQGRCAVIRTRGNAYGHLVLRGGGRPNYDSVSVALSERELAQAGLPENIVVDCSHANSNKDPALQPLVMENCVNQVLEGNRSILGLMVESHLEAGNQSIPEDLKQLRYGVSVTDACVDWKTTETMIRGAADKLRDALPQRLQDA